MTDDQTRNIDESGAKGSDLNVGRIVALIALVVFLIFILQNTQEISIQLIWMTVTFPVWLIGVIVFVLGVIVGYYTKSKKVRAKRKALR